MKNLNDKVVAITGAGSGIGRATAVLLASLGCRMALSDIDEKGLNDTADQCTTQTAKPITTVLNVADRDAVREWAHATREAFGKVNVIINNAGVSLSAIAEDIDYEDFEWLMNINFWGVVYGTKAFLPYLKESGEGHIVNLSSLFGIVAFPTSCAYNASKFAVRGFTESVRQQLAVENAPVKVTCVYPGAINTNIVSAGRVISNDNWGLVDSRQSAEGFKKAARTTPEKAAKVIVKAIRNNQGRILIGADAKLFDAMQRILPGIFNDIVIRVVRHQYGRRAYAN